MACRNGTPAGDSHQRIDTPVPRPLPVRQHASRLAVGFWLGVTGATALVLALPLPADATGVLLRCTGALMAVALGVAAIRQSTRANSRQERAGWWLLSLPFWVAPVAFALEPQVPGASSVTLSMVLFPAAQIVTTVAAFMVLPDIMRSCRDARFASLWWPLPLLLGVLWTVGVEPVLQAPGLTPTARVLSASSPILLALQDTVFLAPIAVGSQRENRGAPLLLFGVTTIGLAQLVHARAMLDRSEALGLVSGFAWVVVLCSIGLGVALWSDRGTEQTQRTSRRHRIAMPLCVAATVAIRLSIGASFGDTIFWIGMVAAVAFLGHTIAERDALVGALGRQARQDALTGLPNRAALQEHLDELTATSTPTTVIFLDLDGFKLVNDELGHAAGDAVLVETAQRLGAALPPSSILARVGGDEFVATVTGPIGVGRAAAVEMLARLAEPLVVGERRVEARASAGLSRLDGDAERALNEADLALYRAKRIEGTNLALFDQGMRIDARRRHQVDIELPELLAEGRLRVKYQPVVDLATGEWVGVETLVRWHDDESVGALEIVEAAEQLGLGCQLADFVVRQAVDDLPRLREIVGRADLWTAVNVSVRQLSDPRLPAQLSRSVGDAQTVRPSDVVIEMTETQFPQDLGDLTATLASLRASGYRVAIDDFGAGYSALAQLGQLPFDIIKLDRQFVEGLPDGADIVGVILELADRLGTPVIAEGIETRQHLDILASMQCALGQGYLWMAPATVEEFAAAFSARRLHAEPPVSVRNR